MAYSGGITTRTLDDWTDMAVTPWAFASAVRAVGNRAGSTGFTVDDVRDFYAEAGAPFPLNPGAVLGSMAAKGELAVLRDEPTRTRTSKGRRILRFILTDNPPVEGGEGT